MNQVIEKSAFDIPAHVDPARVVDFDFFHDPRYAQVDHPHDAMMKLREELGPGIFWTPRNGGHWFITDHEMLFEAGRTPEIFSSVNASFPPVPPEQEAFFPPISTDPPEHIKYRLPLMRAFSPRSINRMAHDIRSLVIELVEEVAAEGRCDFIDKIAEPLPITIFMQLMGFDLSRYREFREWVSWMTGSDVSKRMEAFARVMEMSRPLIEERRSTPRDDLITTLVQEEKDGQPFSQRELEGMCLLLFGAGLDTVVNTLSFAMDYLARDPGLQDRLRGNPDRIPDAVEELLRRYGVVFPVRRVNRDTDFHGAALKEGERVGLYLPVGNFDPDLFPQAHRFDIDRENKAHVTFTIGPHRCVGSHLARVEMITFLEEWLKRIPNVRLDPKRPPSYRTGIVFAVSSLHLEWDRPAAG